MSSLRSLSILATASAIAAAPAFSQGADECASAVLITGSVPFDTSMCSDTGTFATTSSQTVCALTEDVWFRYIATSTGQLTISTCGANFDTEVGIYQGASCGSLTSLACNDDFCALQSEVSAPCTAGQTYYLQVGYWSTAGGVWGQGTLTVVEGAGPLTPPPAPANCSVADDGFEDNDDCGQETALGSGTYLDLFTSKTDWDYYEVTVNNGDTLDVDLYFTHVNGDIDIFLYDVAGCQNFAAGNVGTAGSLVSGFTASDNESILWTNTTGSTQTYIIKVNVWPSTTTGDCNAYHMVIDGANGSGGTGIGTTYCNPAVNNSTGGPGAILATGSTVAANNSVTLSASGLPNNQFGIFINSMSQGFVPMPGGSQGNLCLGGAIGRYNAAGQILNSGVNGSFSLALNLTSTPTPSGPVSIMAGQAWNFQAWYRDLNPAPVSNFTSAVNIQF